MSKGVLGISDAAAIAMHGMIVLAAAPGRLRSTASLATELQVSEAHLAKVMQRLAAGGYVRAQRGPKGGFALARELEDVTMLEILEFVQGPIGRADCLLKLPTCATQECPFRAILDGTNELVRQELGNVRLANVAHVYRKE